MRPGNVLGHCIRATGGRRVRSIRGGSIDPSTTPGSEHGKPVSGHVNGGRVEALGLCSESCDGAGSEEEEAARVFWESSQEEAGDEEEGVDGVWRPGEAYLRNASNHVLFEVRTLPLSELANAQ